MKRFAVAILLALTMPARAEDIGSANYFLPGCKAYLDDSMAGVLMLFGGRCIGFIEGLVYGVEGEDFCQPKGVSAGLFFPSMRFHRLGPPLRR